MIVRRALLACLLLLLLAVPTTARAGIPRDWAGVTVDYDQLLRQPSLLASEMGVMRANGVARIRYAFYWSSAQPYRRMDSVPADQRDRFVDEDGVPTDLSSFDTVVADAVRHGLGVLPVVLGSPGWAAGPNPGGTLAQPRRASDYTRFLTTLVRRYGSEGTFWDDHPGLPRRPIEQWQIWNEPNKAGYWKPPFETSYPGLLRAAHRALQAADPYAQTVAAPLADANCRQLDLLYRHGMKGAYDVLAVNIFTANPQNLPLAIEYNRRVQQRYHDVTPVILTEITWDASGGHGRYRYTWSTTAADQAAKLTQAYTALAAVRRKYDILGVFWYSWLTGYRSGGPFDYTGLRVWRGSDQTPGSKPGLAAYRRVIGRL